VGLAIRRLSIIDVAGGRQPVGTTDGALRCVFNGELYNYRELRKDLLARGHRLRSEGDSECIPFGVLEWGAAGFLRRAEGMFALALWDERDGSLLLARDRMGKKPLYLAHWGGSWVFGSELKALLRHPLARREVDPLSLARYLVREAVPGQGSIYRGVRSVPPGSWVRLRSDGSAVEGSYWEAPWGAEPGPWPYDSIPLPGDAAPRSHWARALGLAVKEAVRGRLVSEVPIGALLSGGVDSSGTAALMAREVPGVRTFSIAFEDESFDERRWSRAVSEHIGSRHEERVFGLSEAERAWDLWGAQLDEPFGDASLLPTWFLSRTVRDLGVTVVLSGDGADELFAGYPTYLAAQLGDGLLRLPGARAAVPWVRRASEALPSSYGNVSLDYQFRRFAAGLGLPAARRQATWLGSFTGQDALAMLSPDLRAQVGEDALWADLDEIAATSRARGPLGRALDLDQRTYLQDDILVKVDRASMAASLEVRSPLLDQRVVELAARMPDRHKLAGWTGKAVWKDVVRPLVPNGVVDRKKKGFGMPVARWLAGPWKERLVDLLGGGRAGRTGWLDQAVVDSLIEEHTSGRRDRRKPLWTLLMLVRWAEGPWGPAVRSGG
jgi:asparagine synthase (glutamine-hydrolysing)